MRKEREEDGTQHQALGHTSMLRDGMGQEMSQERGVRKTPSERVGNPGEYDAIEAKKRKPFKKEEVSAVPNAADKWSLIRLEVPIGFGNVEMTGDLDKSNFKGSGGISFMECIGKGM